MRELQYDTKYNLGSECLAEYKYKKSSISSDLEVKLKADDALVWGLNWLLHPQIGIFLYKNLYFYHLVEGIFAIKYKYKQKFKNRCLRLKYSYIKIKKEKKKKKKKKRRRKKKKKIRRKKKNKMLSSGGRSDYCTLRLGPPSSSALHSTVALSIYWWWNVNNLQWRERNIQIRT